MNAPTDSDFTITLRSDGCVHYRLPDHEWRYLLHGCVLVGVGCIMVGFFNRYQHPFSWVLLTVGALLFFAVIFLAGPLGWYLARGRGEILLTTRQLHVNQKLGPFWRRWTIPLADVRHLTLFTITPGATVRLTALRGPVRRPLLGQAGGDCCGGSTTARSAASTCAEWRPSGARGRNAFRVRPCPGQAGHPHTRGYRSVRTARVLWTASSA